MKLDRDETGRGKYALVRLRGLPGGPATAESVAAALLEDPSRLVLGEPGSRDEFFAIMLKDANAHPALVAYAARASETDPEYGQAVLGLAARSGPRSPFCKGPD
jgi:hypothetical protein